MSTTERIDGQLDLSTAPASTPESRAGEPQQVSDDVLHLVAEPEADSSVEEEVAHDLPSEYKLSAGDHTAAGHLATSAGEASGDAAGDEQGAGGKINVRWAEIWLTEAVAGRCRQVMLSLIYPAFLGTYLVNMFIGDTPVAFSAAWWIALLLIIYFILGYQETLATKQDKYTPAVFVVDLFEILLMTGCFFLLHVVTTGSALALWGFELGHTQQLWGALAILFYLPMLWRFLPESYSTWPLDCMCLAAMAVSLAFAIRDPLASVWPLIPARSHWESFDAWDSLGIFLLYAVLAVYIHFIACCVKHEGAYQLNGGGVDYRHRYRRAFAEFTFSDKMAIVIGQVIAFAGLSAITAG